MVTRLTQNVLLCISEDNKFECKEFKDFIDADEYFKKFCESNVKSTMIQQCKFYPDSFRKKTLKKKIDSLFGTEVKIVSNFNPKYLSKNE